MVGVRRFELLTSSVSGKRSPPELNARISAAGVYLTRKRSCNATVNRKFFSHHKYCSARGAVGDQPAALLALQQRSSLRRIAPFLKTVSAQLGKRRGRLRKGAILCEMGAGEASTTTGKTPAAPPNQTCGLIAVRREGPSRLPAVLLGTVTPRVLLTRRFTERGGRQGQHRTKVSLGRQNDARRATLDVIPAKTSSPAPK